MSSEPFNPLLPHIPRPFDVGMRVIRRGLTDKEAAIRRGEIIARTRSMTDHTKSAAMQAHWFTYTVKWDDGVTGHGYLQIGLEQEPITITRLLGI